MWVTGLILASGVGADTQGAGLKRTTCICPLVLTLVVSVVLTQLL